jgi:dimethylargininase
MPVAKALVRKPSRCFRKALSEHPKKRTIDNDLACKQHLAYVGALEEVGVAVEYLPPLEHCPDGPFVEDTVLVFDDFAVVCPMREISRRDETLSVLERIRKSHSLIHLPEGCEMDGGDVLRAGRQIFVGLSRRTNTQAVSALRERIPYPVHAVSVAKGLHLKSAVSSLSDDVLLFDRSCVDPACFPGFRLLEVAPEEGYSANVLGVGDALILPAGYPKVKAVIEKENLFSKIIELDMSEFEKADGGLTCLSIFIQPAGRRGQ